MNELVRNKKISKKKHSKLLRSSVINSLSLSGEVGVFSSDVVLNSQKSFWHRVDKSAQHSSANGDNQNSRKLFFPSLNSSDFVPGDINSSCSSLISNNSNSGVVYEGSINGQVENRKHQSGQNSHEEEWEKSGNRLGWGVLLDSHDCHEAPNAHYDENTIHCDESLHGANVSGYGVVESVDQAFGLEVVAVDLGKESQRDATINENNCQQNLRKGISSHFCWCFERCR